MSNINTTISTTAIMDLTTFLNGLSVDDIEQVAYKLTQSPFAKEAIAHALKTQGMTLTQFIESVEADGHDFDLEAFNGKHGFVEPEEYTELDEDALINALDEAFIQQTSKEFDTLEEVETFRKHSNEGLDKAIEDLKKINKQGEEAPFVITDEMLETALKNIEETRRTADKIANLAIERLTPKC